MWSGIWRVRPPTRENQKDMWIGGPERLGFRVWGFGVQPYKPPELGVKEDDRIGVRTP